jgi:hypothetical protein
MNAFRKIAEEKIREAIENGEFDNLPDAGKPIIFEDESWIPEDLRIAYRLLKNAGCIPPELEIRKEILSLRNLINTLDDEEERMKRIRELNFKIIKLNMIRKRPLNLEEFPEYEQRIIEKFAG